MSETTATTLRSPAERTFDASSPNTLTEARPTPLGGLARALASAELGALISLAAVLALGIGLILWSTRPTWVPVAERAGREDVLALVEMLSRAGIEHKLDSTSGIVMVPEKRLGEVRVNIAASGLGGDSSIGLELLAEEPSLGTSHFTEVNRYQHGLETELARTISRMRNIESARVHLALPKRSVFVRDSEAASASVMIRPESGRSIDDEQVDAVSRLVASGIPYLDASDVTVVDEWGQLLSSAPGERGANREQYRYTRQLEQLYAERIEALLTPIVGRGRVRATVTADIDFSVSEQTQELFDSDPLQLRSEQTEAMQDSGGLALGIPGALVNQPPAAGTIDTVAGDTESGSPPKSTSSSAVRNYELDKTITHSRQSPGSIRRLSAAVIIDDRFETNADGESVREALDAEAIAAYTALAREAVGFDAARGDSVVVSNRRFVPSEELIAPPPLPIWEQPWVWTMVRQVLTGLGVLLLVVIGVRPALRKLLAGPVARARTDLAFAADSVDGRGESARSDGNAADRSASLESDGGLPPALDAQTVVYGDILNMARTLAADDPKRVARLVKDWVAEG